MTNWRATISPLCVSQRPWYGGSMSLDPSLILGHSIRKCSLSRRETLPVIPRWDLQCAHECRAHLFFAGVAARFGDHFDAIVRLLQAPAGGVQAYCVNRFGRSPAALSRVLPGQVAGTHVNPLGQGFDCQISL